MTQIIVVTVILLFIIFGAGYYREQNEKKAYKESLLKDYGKVNNRKFTSDELKSIRGYELYHRDENGFLIDDTTWNDLDMNLIYARMNYCKSSSGDEYLYNMLRHPQTLGHDWTDFEKKVEGLKLDENLRSELALCLHDIGRSGNLSIYSYLDKLDEAKGISFGANMAGVIAYIPAIAICFFNLPVGIALVFILAVYNIAFYFKQKRKIEPYIICFEYIFKVLKNCDSLIVTLKNDRSSILDEEMEVLNETIEAFASFRRFSSLVVGDLGTGPLAVILDYVKMLTHTDLLKFDSMLAQVKQHKGEIDQILRITGQIDAYMSIGEYRTYLNDHCIPELDDGYKGLEIEEGYHPLISEPVTNSIDAKRSILLTGSNASGKSTFLKMIAINALLSQSIHTVCAKRYKAPYFEIYSSLNVKDNILSGESYYMVEIRSIKRIIDACDRGSKVLGFVDEVLRGTNTVERIAASSAILRNLNSKGVLVFAATHDLELTAILENEYDNYHFDEVIDVNDVRFTYKLSEGKATSRNAIRLLITMGYDNDITDKAIDMAKALEKDFDINRLKE